MASEWLIDEIQLTENLQGSNMNGLRRLTRNLVDEAIAQRNRVCVYEARI